MRPGTYRIGSKTVNPRAQRFDEQLLKESLEMSKIQIGTLENDPILLNCVKSYTTKSDNDFLLYFAEPCSLLVYQPVDVLN